MNLPRKTDMASLAIGLAVFGLIFYAVILEPYYQDRAEIEEEAASMIAPFPPAYEILYSAWVSAPSIPFTLSEGKETFLQPIRLASFQETEPIDFISYAVLRRLGLMPIVELSLDCDEQLVCNKDWISKLSGSGIFYAIPRCEVIDSESPLYSRGLSCEFELREFTGSNEELKNWIQSLGTRPIEPVIIVRDIYAEIMPDYLARVENITNTLNSTSLPEFIVVGIDDVETELNILKRFDQIVFPLIDYVIKNDYMEAKAVAQGILPGFRDGTASPEEHLEKLIYENEAFLQSIHMDITHDFEEWLNVVSCDRRAQSLDQAYDMVLEFLDEQHEKSIENNASGSYMRGIVRASIVKRASLIWFLNCSGYSEGGEQFANIADNCAPWLKAYANASHPVLCGGLIFYPGDIGLEISVEDFRNHSVMRGKEVELSASNAMIGQEFNPCIRSENNTVQILCAPMAYSVYGLFEEDTYKFYLDESNTFSPSSSNLFNAETVSLPPNSTTPVSTSC